MKARDSGECGSLRKRSQEKWAGMELSRDLVSAGVWHWPDASGFLKLYLAGPPETKALAFLPLYPFILGYEVPGDEGGEDISCSES